MRIRQRENKRQILIIRQKLIIAIPIPWQRRKPTNFLIKLCQYNSQCIWNTIAFLMELFNIKAMLTSSE
jgi:hypothetical protein